jgi:hypothetical protein
MTYRIKGKILNIQLTEEEVGEIVAALQLADPRSEVLEAFRQFQREEFAGT